VRPLQHHHQPRGHAPRLFRFTNATPNITPIYNAAPTQILPVVRLDADGQRELVTLKWGLIPFWAKDAKIAHSTINARAETVVHKPAFRAAFKARRCLIPADGFYEWQPGEKRQPYRITMKDGEPFAMAGLWEQWDKAEEPLQSFTIIVTEGNSLMKAIHDRMPVILPTDTWDHWLTAKDIGIPQALLMSYPASRMKAYKVSPRVGSPKNNHAAIIDPLSYQLYTA
jgi:putative SOS response-associated peptidase YedK